MKIKPHKLKNKRIIRRFLLFPREIKGDRRWLEFVKIKQKYYCDGCFGWTDGWKDVKFIDE